MSHPITFHVEHNLDHPELPPWSIHIYPIDPHNAQAPASWTAEITQEGVTVQMPPQITAHATWRYLLATAPNLAAAQDLPGAST